MLGIRAFEIAITNSTPTIFSRDWSHVRGELYKLTRLSPGTVTM